MSLNNKITSHKIIRTKGSVAFVLYFIVGVALLAVAGYYIGINEQTRLFKTLSDKKQQQENGDINSSSSSRSANPSAGQLGTTVSPSETKDSIIKSLIDSPAVVLRNARVGVDSSGWNQGGETGAEGSGALGNSGGLDNSGNTIFGPNVDLGSFQTISIFNFANQASYFIKTNDSKNGREIALVNGQAKGDTCYNTALERVCYPSYKLNKIWSAGDLNSDGKSDAIISISALESVAGKKIITDNYYALISGSSTVIATSTLLKGVSSSTSTSRVSASATSSSRASATTSATTSRASATTTRASAATTTATSTQSIFVNNYNIIPFNYGIYSPLVSSAEINEGSTILIGRFYVSGDAVGSPSINKAIRYKFEKSSTTPYSIKKISEAKLFKEQGENTSLWYSYDYTFSGINFAFKAPETWQREENFDKGVRVVFKETEGRSLVFNTKSIVETCSEYGFNLGDSLNVKINKSEFIDLGQFGVGSYIKYSITNSGMIQYHADICVTDKNSDKKVFSLYSTTSEDASPYYAMFDKILSTFRIK